MIIRTYPQLAPVDIPQLWEAFQRFAHRPQPFVRTLGQILNPIHPPERGFERQVLEMADLQRTDDERAIESAKGEYALDDATMKAWFKQRSDERNWPPTAPNLLEANRANRGQV